MCCYFPEIIRLFYVPATHKQTCALLYLMHFLESTIVTEIAKIKHCCQMHDCSQRHSQINTSSHPLIIM